MKKIIYSLIISSIVYLFFVTYNSLFSKKACITNNTTQDSRNLVFSTREREVYKIKYRNKVTFFIPQKNITNISLDGYLNFRVFQVTSRFIYAGIQCSDLDIKVTGFRFNDKLKELYQKFFIVKFNKNGMMEKFYFPNSNEDDFKSLQALINNLQFIVKNKSEYTTIEKDTLGKYTANYFRTYNKINKSKMKYILFCDQNKDKSIEIITSKLVAQLSENDWIDKLKYDEEFNICEGNIKVLNSVSSLTLLNVPDKSNDKLLIWKEDRNIKDILDGFKKKKKIQFWKQIQYKSDELYIQENDISVENILNSISTTNNTQKLYDDLELFLKLNPKEAYKLKKYINMYSDDIAMNLINVLEMAETIEAQETLMQIVDSEQSSHMNKIRAIIALSDFKNPSDKLIDFLWDIQEHISDNTKNDIQNTALLALGIISSKIDPDLSIDIDNRLRDKLASTEDDSEKEVLLLAMQNSGSNKFRRSILKQIDSRNARVRKIAISSLEGVDDEKIKNILFQEFNEEDNPIVRSTIIKTLQTLSPSEKIAHQISQNVLEEQDSSVRKEMIKYLVKVKDIYPQYFSVLKQLLTKETVKSNIKIIIRAIR